MKNSEKNRAHRLFCAFACGSLGLALGCGEPPAPVGPAAEASIADIEISIDVPVTSEASTEDADQVR